MPLALGTPDWVAPLKRYFPIPYLIVATAAIVHSIVHLVRERELDLAWLGALLAVVPLVSFMSSLMLFQRARTGRNQYLMLSLAVLGTLLAFVDFESPPSWYALFLGLIPSFAYVFWYSVYDERLAGPIALGAPWPQLELVDTDGEPVTPAPGKHALYMFVRGNWCPLCMAQVKEIAAQYRELEARGVEVFLVSRQPEAQSKALARRFDAPIRFCVDANGEVARRLGIEHRGGLPFLMEPLGYDVDSVLSTTVIVDPEGTIIFADLTDNYRVRPELSAFLAAIDAQR